MPEVTPEVKRLMLAAIRAARWVPEGDLVSGCVHDSRDAVAAEVLAAVEACRTGTASTGQSAQPDSEPILSVGPLTGTKTPTSGVTND